MLADDGSVSVTLWSTSGRGGIDDSVRLPVEMILMGRRRTCPAFAHGRHGAQPVANRAIPVHTCGPQADRLGVATSDVRS